MLLVVISSLNKKNTEMRNMAGGSGARKISHLFFQFLSKGFVANVDRILHFVNDLSRTLYHAAIKFGPLKNVLLTHNVRVDEQVAISHAEVFLTGGAFEAFQVIDFVTDTHGHFEGPDPLFTGSTEPVLTKQSAEKKTLIHTLERQSHTNYSCYICV